MGLFSGGGLLKAGAAAGLAYMTGGTSAALMAGGSSLLSGAAANKGNAKAAQINEEQRDKARTAINTGADTATGYLTPQLEAGRQAFDTGADYMRTVVARDPNQLTPQQKIDLADRARVTMRGINPGLRGSGRFTTAAINDVVNRGKAGMIQTNQTRSDQAGGQLFSTGANMSQSAAGNLANVATGQAKDVANIETGYGTNAGNAAVAQGQVNADTIGAIGSVFADAMKQGRNGRYDEYRAASTQ